MKYFPYFHFSDDHSRVILKPDGVKKRHESDYVNANHIQVLESKLFICVMDQGFSPCRGMKERPPLSKNVILPPHKIFVPD